MYLCLAGVGRKDLVKCVLALGPLPEMRHSELILHHHCSLLALCCLKGQHGAHTAKDTDLPLQAPQCVSGCANQRRMVRKKFQAYISCHLLVFEMVLALASMPGGPLR